MLFFRYSSVSVTLCMSLSCWKINILPSQRYLVVFIRFSSRICLYYSAFFYPLPLEACQAFPQHDAATTAVHCGDGVFLICSVWLMPNMPHILMAKHFNFGLIRPQNLLPTSESLTCCAETFFFNSGFIFDTLPLRCSW